MQETNVLRSDFRASSMTITLSAASDADQSAIDHLLDLAFGLSRRAKTSYRLREGASAVSGLSHVVREAELGIVGTISYWPLAIGAAGTPAILLGPIAVHPQRQNRGIGLALMNDSIAMAKVQGHRLILLIGDAPYYERVGFKQVPVGQMLLPGPHDPKRFMYLELVGGSLADAKGLVLPQHRFAG
jgi:predicted N-acetyltransferase YhbS